MYQYRDLGLGASYLGNGRCRFRVWAPKAQTVAVHLQAPEKRAIPLTQSGRGYFEAIVERVGPGTRYLYSLDGSKERPDPASQLQPEGVHGPSEVTAHDFAWDDHRWFNHVLQDYIIYELHVGTFTLEGTFDAVIPQLERLVELGVTAIEVMPIAQFPGSRNWGYDGVYPFAVQASYGGPAGFKRLVEACHRRGLAVVLDVVYNHLGPEGNYCWDYGPYFTDRYTTSWGSAVNFDGPHSDEVRRFFIENALFWIREFHVDALRLDATHAMMDLSARTFLEELTAVAKKEAARLGRRVYLIAENDKNDARVISAPEVGGYGLDALWSDEFHHTLHTSLTGERAGYYADFGDFQQFVKAYREGFVYTGQYSPARERRHGTSGRHLPAERFVICTQNHDQVGNRMLGERLGQLVTFADLKLAAGAMLLAPYLPLLFMGEEYGETAPFLYFVSHGDPDLIESVRRGRQEEFAAFNWKGTPPDPQAEATFERSRLDHFLAEAGRHRVLFELYTELIQWRKCLSAEGLLEKSRMEVVSFEHEQLVLVRYDDGDKGAIALFNLGEAVASLPLSSLAGRWQKAIDSAAPRWQERADAPSGDEHHGTVLPGELDSQAETTLRITPKSFALYMKQEDS